MKTTMNNIWMMNLISDKNGEPMMAVLTADDYMTFPLVKSFDIHNCNEFLRSLNLGIDIEFKSYQQYNKLIKDCAKMLMGQEAVMR